MRELKNSSLNCIAFPLGGIGTGNISLAGDGSLRQWQIVNNVYHLGFIPASFFFVQTQLAETDKWKTKILEKDIKLPKDFEAAETVNDHIIPQKVMIRHEKYDCVQDLIFEGEYPFAKIKYIDEEIPIEIKLEAWNPMIPLDVKNSSLPIIIFNFEILNPNKEKTVDIRLGGTMLNFIGWDGLTDINLEFFPNFYANINRPVSISNIKGIEMISENSTLEDSLQGDIIFATMNKDCKIISAYDTEENILEIIEKINLEKSQNETIEPSPHGKTWAGAIINEITLAPLEKKNVVFLLSWSFPNRYKNWEERRLYRNVGVDNKSKFWIGNRYNRWFKGAKNVIEYALENFEFLETKTQDFYNLLFGTTIPDVIIDSISATMSILRSPSCFLTKKGEFMGFEGCCGASTSLHTVNHGGCCPMNCTHVWNYAVTQSRLYPSLEISMLENEFLRITQEGLLPHRLIVPTYLPQAENVQIGGPENPAIDGLFGCILKTYRMLLNGNDFEWFKKIYPKIRKLMNYIFQECDPDEQGVIEGEQPNTYDISFFGPNLFIGSLYLAALKAMEKMAEMVSDDGFKKKCINRFDNGKKNYDTTLWNGEYWIQIYDEKIHKISQYGKGCLSDQLFGQFWAYMLQLGTLLPEDKLEITLDSIMKYNYKENFYGYVQKPRIFASEHDSGLLACTWPKGGEPRVPFPYAHEVWTGMEYEVAALMIEHGKLDNALTILKATRARYDGTYRNPWNEVECGDHYIRAMASWRVFEAALGYHWNGIEKQMNLLPRFVKDSMRAFYITDSSWGMIKSEIVDEKQEILIKSFYGKLELAKLRTWKLTDNAAIDEISIDNVKLEDKGKIIVENDTIDVKFKKVVIINQNQQLFLRIN